MKILNRLLFFAIVLATAACASPSKLYRSGNYHQAVIEAVRKLRSSPDNKKSQDALVLAYPMAVKMSMREIHNASQSNSVTRYDVIIRQYEQLNRLANEILTCPKAYQLISSPQEFHTELRQTKDIAAEHYYVQGVRALNQRTLEQAKQAYRYFVKSNEYVRGYRDVIAKIEEALFAATLHVIVEAPKTPERFQFSSDFFYSNLVTEMNKSNQQRFVHFYTPIEAHKDEMNDPHQRITLDFIEFAVGNIRESKSTQDVKRDSVPITVEVSGNKVTAYITAKAKLTTHKREIISSGKLHVRVMDASNNRIVEQRTFDGSYVWTSVWGSYTGDDRALSTEQKRLVQQQPTLPPPNQDLFVEFTKPIYTQVVAYIKNVYRNYQ